MKKTNVQVKLHHDDDASPPRTVDLQVRMSQGVLGKQWELQ
jgi:hypothetical protein